MNGKQQTRDAHLKSHRPLLTSNDGFYGLQIAKHFEFFSNRTHSCQMETTGKRPLALASPIQKVFQVRNKDIHQNMKEVFCAEKCKSKIYTACSKEIETKT